MDSTHVIALIAAVLQVRNQVGLIGMTRDQQLDAIAQFGDPIEEARQLIQHVVSDEPAFPDAPNTKGGMPSTSVGSGD